MLDLRQMEWTKVAFINAAKYIVFFVEVHLTLGSVGEDNPSVVRRLVAKVSAGRNRPVRRLVRIFSVGVRSVITLSVRMRIQMF